jgi:hypothetical protein
VLFNRQDSNDKYGPIAKDLEVSAIPYYQYFLDTFLVVLYVIWCSFLSPFVFYSYMSKHHHQVVFDLCFDKKSNKKVAKNVRLTDEPVPGT